MQIATLSDADLLARLKNFEDHFVERKTSGDKKDWLKTVVAFANSAPTGFPCVLYLGVKDDGEIETPQVNLDSLQKTFNKEMQKAYPPVPYLPKIVNDGERQALAVIVLGSESRPHFSGPAYVRKASETWEASEQQFEELVAQRNSKTARILQSKGEQVTVFVSSEESEIAWPKNSILVDCDQFYVTIQALPHEPPHSFPLSRVEINRDNLRKTLQLEISDGKRSAWELGQEQSARQILGHMMTHEGRLLLGWLMKQGRIECTLQFMSAVSLTVQNRELEIAIKEGLVRCEQEDGGFHRTYYIVNPEYLRALRRVMPEFG